MTLTFYRDYQELFAGCWAYYPNTLVDIVGGYHATNQGGTLTATDRFGGLNKNYYFSGVIGVNAILPTTVASTVSANTNNTILIWGKKVGGSNSALLSKPCDSTGLYYDWYLSNDGIIVTTGTTRNALWYTPVPTNWNLHAFTYNQTILIGYLNGIAFNSVSASGAIPNRNSTTTLYKYPSIGSWANGTESGAAFSNVSIGEIWFFNRVLSAAEIKMLYDLTKSKYLYPVLPGQRGVE